MQTDNCAKKHCSRPTNEKTAEKVCMGTNSNNEFERSRIEEFDNKTTSNKNCKKCVPSHDLPVRLLHFGLALSV